MRCPELAMSHADLTPRLDEFAVGRELANARRGSALDAVGNSGGRSHALSIVPVGDVDAAVGPHDDVVGLVELTIDVARLARDAEAQELLASWTELVDLMPLRPRCITSEVRNPHVALTVHVNAMRRHHQTLAEVCQHRAGGAIKLEDRIDQVGVTCDVTAPGPSGS